MNTCENCGSFSTIYWLYPSGCCAAQGQKLVKAGGPACLKWQKDFRGLAPGGAGDEEETEREKGVENGNR